MSHYILIHGAWEESRAWNDVSPVLEKAGHTVTALDLPGHGENLDLAMDEPLGYNSLAAGLHRLLEEVNAATGGELH